MRHGTTNFLRLTIVFIGLGVLALCIFALPSMWTGGSREFPSASYALLLIMLGMYATAIPFYVGLWQAFKLLHYIDENKAFSDMSVKALRNIKYCAAIIATLYIGGIPLLFPIADADDAPGLIIIGTAIACAPLVIATFASVLERLIRKQIETR